MTELVFILDRSGSMAGLETDTIGGFNSMIAKQKKEAGEALVSNDGPSTNCRLKDYIFWRAHRRSVTPFCTPVPVQIQGGFQCQSLHRVGRINRQQHP